MKKDERVAILLCTYNGIKFLNKQLDSIINQTYQNWVVFVSDDGSTDGTIDIIHEYQQSYGQDKIVLIGGPNKGFAWNFISALEYCGEGFDYFAFCDQDDEWLDEKLTCALNHLTSKAGQVPAVYCGRTILTDAVGREIGLSPLFTKTPSFRNALVQSIAGGNTMVMNKPARDIVINTPKWQEIISHDWWVYLLITGCGGSVYYDRSPTIKYRQHQENIIGSNLTIFARFQRIKKLMGGHFKRWNDKNIELLKPFREQLTTENAKVLRSFENKRNADIFSRIKMIYELRLYRQTLCGNIALIVAIFLNKI
ncbi:glycosyltransferase family 2 protein [Citrobacter sp. RHB35-C21]|uniref:glycosyltransferase family 2 protein n=1 Tax=Citrobacter sp. RHB35-C21 TaxID=2742626 RepID=UPI0015E9C96F|nr:glycosyltransferase family 2 protein [Citrobacter sp. RHB35-C21]QMD52187.1 glycosyltransferase family 2 protein [Citrobacter sp. RHB35-C21]